MIWPGYSERRIDPYAASQTALQRPPLTFGLITTTVAPYCHTQPPPVLSLCHLTCTVGSLQLTLVEILGNRSQSLLLSMRDPTKFTVNFKHS